MLHRIKGLFQKTLCSKTGKTGERTADSCGLKMEAGRGDSCGGHLSGNNASRRQLTAKNATRHPIQQNQHGRTMTEMLGVLVIVGILSIGALAGYRYAMDKQRANVTINDINLRGVDLVIQASRNIPLNLDEWDTTSTAGYTFGTPEHVADGFVKLSVSGLPERVCEMVVDGLSTQYDMDINGAQIDAGASCGDDNIITVYFDATGSTGADDVCGGCPGAQTCVDGACVCTNGGEGENCTCNGTICGECQKCQGGACVNKPKYTLCSTGYCDNGVCAPSPCSENKPLMDFFGKCYSCDTTSSVYISGVKGNCAVCGNRVVKDNYCVLPECPADKPLRDYDGSCFSCNYENEIFVLGEEENCTKICGAKRAVYGSYCYLACPSDKPLIDRGGKCYSCDETGEVDVSGIESSCNVCKNREIIFEVPVSFCSLSKCPPEKPLRDYVGVCYSCDTDESVYVYGVEENCRKTCGDDRKVENGYCILSKEEITTEYEWETTQYYEEWETTEEETTDNFAR